jgi:hypothetical protein
VMYDPEYQLDPFQLDSEGSARMTRVE